MKKRMNGTIALCMSAIITAGCFGPALTANAENADLSFFTGKVETVELLDEIIEEFNAQENGITVEQEYQNDASNIIKIKFASGEVPDIVTTYEQQYVDQGKYLDSIDSFHEGQLYRCKQRKAVSYLYQYDYGRFLL